MASKSEYRNGWIAEKLDRINLTVPKGKKDTIKAHAEAQGESVNGFINRAIDETMERDSAVSAVSEDGEKPQA
ncbi:MAG: Arc family DNA-binding protein [Dysosmobacter sp.]|nr:Arc family DNA-binding protein [Dysosmobacter sp.]